MHRLTRDLVRLLAAHHGEGCVSIYLPTHRRGPETRQDPIRLKNLLSEARRALAGSGQQADSVDHTLQPLERLIGLRDFWMNQGDGLALFANAHEHWVFRLPIPVDRLAMVGSRFHLKPIMPLVTQSGRFYLLALSRHRVRLFEATRSTMRELDSDDIPDSLADVVGYDWQQRSLQFHSTTPSGTGRRRSEFHGHGAGRDDKDGELEAFLRQVDRGVRALIDDPTAPLVLATVDELHGEYGRLSRHQGLVDGFVHGNPDSTDEKELLAAAWKVVEPMIRRQRRTAADRVRSMLVTGRAVERLEDVVVAAAEGRVHQLFVAGGIQRWGRFEPGRRAVTVHGTPEPSDEDLLNRATVDAITHDATVFVVPPDEVPSDRSPVAAVLRY